MPSPSFSSLNYLSKRIDAYFAYIEGELGSDNNLDEKKTNQAKKIWSREPEPATITGLALFLGFTSRTAFEDYEENGKYADTLKRGRLRIEAMYERRLHQQSSPGIIFALKSMGWNEKTENKTTDDRTHQTLKIEIMGTGPILAANENEVVL